MEITATGNSLMGSGEAILPPVTRFPIFPMENRMTRKNAVIFDDGAGSYFFDCEVGINPANPIIGNTPLHHFEPVAIIRGPLSFGQDFAGNVVLRDGPELHSALGVISGLSSHKVEKL